MHQQKTQPGTASTPGNGLALSVVTPEIVEQDDYKYPVDVQQYESNARPMTSEAVFFTEAVSAPQPPRPMTALTPWVVREPVWPARIKVLAWFVGLLGIALLIVSIFQRMWNGVIVGCLAIPLGFLGYHAASNKNRQEARLYSVAFGIFTIISLLFNILVGALFLSTFNQRCEEKGTPEDKCSSSKDAFIIFWVLLMVIELAVYSACTLCGHSFHEELRLFDQRQQHMQQTLYARERAVGTHLGSLATGYVPQSPVSSGPPRLLPTVSGSSLGEAPVVMAGHASSQSMHSVPPRMQSITTTTTTTTTTTASPYSMPQGVGPGSVDSRKADMGYIHRLIQQRDPQGSGTVGRKQAMGILQEFGVVVSSKSEFARSSKARVPVDDVLRAAQWYMQPSTQEPPIPPTLLLSLRREFSEADTALVGTLSLAQFAQLVHAGTTPPSHEVTAFFHSHATRDEHGMPRLSFAQFCRWKLQEKS